MKRRIALLSAIAFCAMCSTGYALWSVAGKGAWPEDWPKELEPLRKQSGTIEGGMIMLITHHIPFTKREEFEAAWPHILKIKTKGAPIVLLRGPSNHWHFGKTEAGVLIHCPPGHGKNQTQPATPIPHVTNLRERWLNTTYIELTVDGNIVDLNRIPLPADTPIIDKRFEDTPEQ